MSKSRRILLGGIACAFLLVSARAQDTTTSSTTSGTATVSTEVKSAKVLYVSGNDLVVKMDDGQVKHFVVPDDKTVTVDGKELTVHNLQPGMRLTRTITTTTTPRTITTVRTIKGTVWYVNPPNSVILTLADGKNKQYKVPKDQTFQVDGEKRDVFALKKGMVVSAMVMTETPEVVAHSTRSVTGIAPPPPPATPPAPVQAAILIEEPMTAAPAPVAVAEAAPAALPKTGSNVPLIGLLGLLCLGTALALHTLTVVVGNLRGRPL
jgi:LPXTG-motif cell wall-anchored protein